MQFRYLIIPAAAILLVGCGQKTNSENREEVSTSTEKEHVHNDAIVLSVEKANKFGVKCESINPAQFHKTFKVSGEILPAQGDSYTVSAPSDGTVKFFNNISEGAFVSTGQPICSVAGDKIVGGDSNRNALITYQAAKRELERLTPLYKERIVTEREFNAAKEAFEKAELAYRPGSVSGILAKSGISGAIISLPVKDGEYVSAGTAVAVVNKNARLQLRADVPEKYFKEIPSIVTANIKTAYSEYIISLQDLNGKVISSGNAAASTGYIPLIIEFDNKNNFASGSFAEVFLIGQTRENVLSVPVNSVTEELGNTFVYVQLHDDIYDKRPVKPGNSDGSRIEILSGLTAGEKVVTEGVMFVRLSAGSSEIPSACNHAH